MRIIPSLETRGVRILTHDADNCDVDRYLTIAIPNNSNNNNINNNNINNETKDNNIITIILTYYI